MTHALTASMLSLGLFLSACAGEQAGPDASAAEREDGEYGARAALPAYFDCVREAGGVLIASHRAGPAPGYAENALETLRYGFDNGITVFEIDVAESRDGVLFLMHDRSLGRTTTGRGAVADTDWSEISGLRLIDNEAQVTEASPPRLSDVLLWARNTGAIVELDRKPTTSFRNIISSVRAAEAEDHVIMISYNDREAEEIARLAPDLMMTASARGGRDIGALEAAGVDPTRLIAWTGTREPNAAAWSRNAREGVESAFGTLGRRGERLDDRYIADGDLSEYVRLVEDGLVLLATDEPYLVADALEADDRALAACGR
ncbi:MAG: glycerophosphodiester phosphodiesterase family protein [Pseudomonadota bacterium]